MELDDLKAAWNSDSDKTPQQHLTPAIINQVLQKKYHSKINSIAYPEIAGIVICIAAAIYTGLNFYKLNTPFLQGTGIVCIAALLSISVVSFLSLRQLTIPGDFNKPYAETLKLFATQKVQFYKLQKINLTISYLLLVTVVILLSKFFGNKNITTSKYFWTFAFSGGYIFLLFFSKFVSRWYTNTLKKSEELLQELQ